MKSLKISVLALAVFGMLSLFQNVNAQCSHSSASKGSSTNYSSHAGSGVEHMDIVGLAVNSESLSTLVAALKAGGLVSTLQGDGPFTVFAPTNEAFEALPEGTLASLLKPENKQTLVDILTYHVVPGKIMSTDLKDGQHAKTVQGKSVMVDLNEVGVKINEAYVLKADIGASNGVVHVIDRVILPPSH